MAFFIGTPYTRNAGYFRNDNRVSGGNLSEDDVKTCTHCQAVILMREWRQMSGTKLGGAFCMKCNAPICSICGEKIKLEGCVPFIQKLERDMDMTVKLKQFLKEAGLTPEPVRPIFTGIMETN